MIKKLQYLSLFIIFPFAFLANGQEVKIKKADKEYENFGYMQALEIYLKVADKGYESEELFKRLGNSYYFNADYHKALKWYDQLFDLNDTQDDVYSRRYAQTLQATGNTEKAKEIYNLTRSEAILSLSAEDYLYLIAENSDRYAIEKLNGVNTNGREFGHTYKDGTLIYSSTRDTGVFVKRKSSWDGLAFLDVYKAEITADTLVNNISKIKGEVNAKYHESSAVVTKDGKTMYFTRSVENKNNNRLLNIYRANLFDDKWKDVEKLSINLEGYSTAHPALGKDEEFLYFASDRPGGMGESDLYRAAFKSDGSLDEPENLGETINTKGRETFPFLSSESELYFSSDGHFGLGGLDIFYVKVQDDANFSDILNVGKPVNSYADDFSFGIDVETKKGFFSSNRLNDEELGNDNIYWLQEDKAIKNLYLAKVTGQVVDKDDAEPISGAGVKLFDGTDLIDSTTTDEEGNYNLDINYFKSYTIRAGKENYDTEEKPSETKRSKQEINFRLIRNSLALTPGTDISGALNIKHILFDFDKSNIRRDARVELEKLLTLMQEYPDLKIEIRSHTDSRGNDSYNMALSERRAQSTLQYLVKNGIDENRLRAKGFGEERLINDCTNGVGCSEAQHQENRRSGFIVF